MRIHCLCFRCCVPTIIYSFCLSFCQLCVWTAVYVYTCVCVFMNVFRSIYKPARFNALLQHWPSITISLQRLQDQSQTLRVCLPLVSLFSLSPFTHDLSLSFSQTAPLPYLPTVRLNHFLLSHVLYLLRSAVNLPLIFLPLLSVTRLSSLLLSPLILSGLHLADCTLFSFVFSLLS